MPINYDDYKTQYKDQIAARRKKQREQRAVKVTNKNFSAPVKKTTQKKDSWFQAGAFSDGYDFGDITKTILGTAGDVTTGVVKGVARLGEGLGDAISYGVAGVSDLFGADDYADKVRKNASESFVDKVAKPLDNVTNKYSVLGSKGGQVPEGLGQVAAIIATGGLGAGAGLGTVGTTALTTGVTGLSSFGSGVGEAYKGGATDSEATIYGLISGLADAGTELIFGGLGKTVKATGLSTGLSSADDMLAKKISSKFSSQLAKNLSEYAIKAGAEGSEEVMAGILQGIGKKVTYMSEEELGQIIKDENLLDQFIVGAVTSGLAQAPGLVKANKTGTDFITGYTEEQQVLIDNEVNNRVSQLEKQGTKVTSKEKNKIIEQVEQEFNNGTIQSVQEDIAPVQEVAPVETQVQNVKDIDNQIAVLEEQLMATENEVEYQRLSDEIKRLEIVAEQIEQNQDIAPFKAASVEQTNQPTTQETNSNSLVEVESNTQNNPENRLSDALVREIQYKTKKANENKENVQMASTNEINTNEKNGGYRTQEQISKLTEDIKRNGIVKPIEVKINNDGSIEVVDGNHRLSIAKEIGLKEIPVKYVNDNLGNIDNSQEILYNNENEEDLSYYEGEFNASNRNGENINQRDDRSRINKEDRVNNNVTLENERRTGKHDKLSNKVQGDNDRPSSTSTHGQNNTPTQEELDNLEYTRKNKSGSEYASAFYSLEKKYGSANLYKGLNNYKSTGKALVEDIAPIKAELTDLTKDLKTTIKDTKKELKTLKTELNEVKEEISDVVEEYKAMSVTELPGYEQQGTDSIRSIPDNEIDNMVAPVREDTTPEYEFENDNEGTQTEVRSPLEDRTLEEVGSRKVKAYQYEHPEVRPYFQEAAKLMLNDLDNSQKGQRTIIGDISQTGNGNYEFSGQKRHTTDDIAALLDSQYNYTYDDIRKGLKAIIEDHGAENIAVAKRIEFALDDRLRNGYTDVDGYNIPANEEYINLLETNEWNDYLSSIQDDDIAPLEAVQDSNVIEPSTKLPDKALYEIQTLRMMQSDLETELARALTKTTEKKADYETYKKTYNKYNNQILELEQDIKNIVERYNKPNISKQNIVSDDIAPVQEVAPIKEQSLAIEEAPISEEVDNGGPMLKVSPEMEVKTPQVKTDTETPALEGNKNLSVKESNALKLKNLEISLKQYNYDAEQSLNSFNELISRTKEQYNNDVKQTLDLYNESINDKQTRYNALKKKNTKKANLLLQQINKLSVQRDNVLNQYKDKINKEINRITAQRDNTQIEYERKMNNLEKRIDKMNSVDFKRAEQRMTKQEEYRKQANELIGDTSTWTDKKLGIQYQINTLKRNLRDIVKGVDGKADIQRADAIYNEYQGKYDTNEADLKVEYNRLAEPFRNRKLTRHEEVYTQMLGEFKYNPDTTIKRDAIDGYYNKHKNKIDVDKVNQTIEDARKLYDELFERINDRLRKQGMKELEYRRGYFPHFTEEKQSMLAKLFDWKIQNDQIPTDIAGLTELNNPERSWQSFNKHREGDTTDYNFSKGFDTYVHGALDWIYHIEDIQKRRALENEIRYQHSEEGVKKKIEEIYSNPDLDADEVQTQIEAVYGVAKNPLNNFVTDLRNSTNNLAGKKSTLDRSLEYATNRQIYSTVTNLSNRVSGNMIAGSISSALTNFIPITQSWGEVSPVSSLRALGETIKSAIKNDGTIAKSTFLTNRLVKAESLYKSNWDKAADKVGIMTDAIDSITSQVVWRAKYNENMKAGMNEFEAIKNADQFAEGVIAGRSRGNQPTLFNSKNPITKMFTAFQLEVNNQYHYMFKDMPVDVGSKSKAKLIKGYATMFVGAYLYNALYSSLVGRDVAFDPIGLLEGILKELGIGGDDEEENEKTASEKFTAITEDLVQQIPFVGGLFGGGRVPISAAIPYENPIEMVKGTATDSLDAIAPLFSDDEKTKEKSERALKDLTSEWLKPVTYLALPFGGGQINKTIQGLSMYDDELPIAGSYTNSGDLRFTADESTWGKVQAGLFGRWASESAQEYVDSGFKTVKKSNIDEMLDLDMTSSEYRKYRNGLSKAIKEAKGNDDLTQTQAAANYIEGLDVSDSQKSIMLENYFKSNLDEEAEKELDALNMTSEAKLSYFTAKSKIGTLENDYNNSIEKLKKRYDEDSEEYEEKSTALSKEKHEKVINEVLNASLNDDEKKYLYSKYYSSEKALNKITDTGTSMDTYLNFVKDTMYFTSDLDDDGKTISGSLNNKYEEYLLDSNLSDEEKTALYEYGVLSGYDDEDKYKDYKTLKTAGVDINSWLDFDSQIFEADYKSNGKAISGSKKNKVISYVNSLDLLIPQKAMMIRTMYTSFDNYNNDIVNYVVDLDIDYEEKVFMIESLGMRVSDDGTVRW